MTNDATHEPGTVLSYEDQANLYATFVVVRFVPADATKRRFSSEYELRDEAGELCYSDCRQAGWRVV